MYEKTNVRKKRAYPTDRKSADSKKSYSSDKKTTSVKKSYSSDSQDAASVVKKMQHQLDSIEEKLDTLLSQSNPRTFSDKRFSKPRKEYGSSSYSDDKGYGGKKEEGDAKGKFYSGRPFNKKKSSSRSSVKKGKRK